MKCTLLKSIDAEIKILPFWQGPKEAAKFSLKTADFTGKHGETLLVREKGERILLLGLGPKEKARPEMIRRAYAAGYKAVKKWKKVDCVLPTEAKAAVEGFLLASYHFSFKEEKGEHVESVNFIGDCEEFEKIRKVVDGVKFVRDLVHENADVKIPEKLAAIAKKLHPKVKTTVFDKKRLKKEGMRLILAVGRASEHDPVLILAEYKGNPGSKEHIVLVGKGITYDTGGLSLKPTDGMLTMKCDMAGAATVMGAVKVAAELGLKVNVTAVVPSAENAIGSKSYKLGDVYKSYNGKTVEITNTDAEGRLVLADAIGYAVKKLKPTKMIDLATLTGACVIALGEEIAGLFSNDDELADDLMSSSEKTDELLCRIPVHMDYRESYNSDIADIVNSSGRDAGAIKAAIFLHEFVEKTAWAHLDIAGPAFWTKPKHYNPMKATGFALRLLVDFLERKPQ